MQAMMDTVALNELFNKRSFNLNSVSPFKTKLSLFFTAYNQSTRKLQFRMQRSHHATTRTPSERLADVR